MRVLMRVSAVRHGIAGILMVTGLSNFIAIGMVADDAPIVFEGSDAAGTGFTPITYLDNKGERMVAQLATGYETIQLVGPIDFRINKPITINAVEVSQYT